MNIKNLKNTCTYTRGRFKNKKFEIRGHWSQSAMASDASAVMKEVLAQLRAATEMNQKLMARMAEMNTRENPKIPATEIPDAPPPENEQHNEAPPPDPAEQTPSLRRSPRRKKTPSNKLVTPKRKPSTPASASLRRTNSLTDSLREKKRQAKTPQEQRLRQNLGNEFKLGADALDDKLLNGELHGSDGEFNLELIEHLTDDVMNKQIKCVYGSDYSDEELPNKAFAMVKDVIEKRWIYKADPEMKKTMKTKRRNRKRRKKKTPRKRKRIRKTKSTPPPKVKKEIVFNSDYTKEQARALMSPSDKTTIDLASASDDEESEVECCDKSHKLCHKTFARNEGFPELARKSGMMLRCRPCHDKHVATLRAEERAQQKKRENDKEKLLGKKADAAARDAVRKKSEADEKANKKKATADRAANKAAKKRKAADKKAADKKAADKKAADKKAADKKAAAKKAARRKKPTDYDNWKFPITGKAKLAAYFKKAAVQIVGPPRRIYIYKFRPGSNVLGFWPGTGAWYQAQVYGRHGYGQYKLYFPEDNSVYIGAPECHVKAPGDNLWAKVDRRKYTGLEFDHVEQEEDTPSVLGRYKVGDIQSSKNQYMCEHKETKKNIRLTADTYKDCC